jgi:hypothetical protein
VAYDNFHKVECFENHLEVQWFLYNQKITYDEIQDVLVAEDVRSFTTVTLKLVSGKKAFYFVDDALAFKAFIHSKKHKESDQIAA